MKLSITERIALLGVLPKEGNAVTLKLVRELRGDLSFSEDEIKRFSMEISADGSVRWDADSAEDREYSFGDTTKGIISDSLRRSESQKQLPLTLLSLYERLIEDKEG